MRLGGGNVLAVQVAVDVDRGVDLRHDRVGLRREAAAPHLVTHVSTEPVPRMTASTDDVPRPPRRRARIAAIALIGAAAGLAAVYGMGALTGNKAEAACRPAVETTKRLAPLSRGEVAAVAVASTPHRLPALTFR